MLVEPALVMLIIDLETGGSTYGFACPSCSSAVWNTALGPTAEMLQVLGASVGLVAVPD